MLEVVVDVGSWGIKAVKVREIVKSENKIVLDDYLIFPFPVSDLLGSNFKEKGVLNEADYQKFVSDFVARFKIKNSYTFLLFPGYFTRYMIRSINVQIDDMLDQAVDEQLRDAPLIPIPIQDQIIQWQVLEKKKLYRVLLSSLIKENLFTLAAPWSQAGVILQGVDFDIYNLPAFVDNFTSQDPVKPNLTIVAHLGANDSVIQLYHQNLLKAVDTLKTSDSNEETVAPTGQSMTKLLIQAKRFNYQEAEKFKKEANIIPEDTNKANPNFDIIRDVLYTYLSSMNNLVDRRISSLRLDVTKGYLIFTGGAPLMKNFKEFIKKNWYFDIVDYSQIWKVVRSDGTPLTDDEISLLAPCLGVWLREA